MKIYLAAPYAGRDIVEEQVPMWALLGADVTCSWVHGTRPIDANTLGTSPGSALEEVTRHATMDLNDVARADALVLYTANYLQQLEPSLGDVTHQLHSGGRHIETGFALAREMPVVILGEPENIFHRGLCMQAFSPGQAVGLLKDALQRKNLYTPTNQEN